MARRWSMNSPEILAQRRAWRILLDHIGQEWQDEFWVDYDLPHKGRVYAPYGAEITIRKGDEVYQGPVIAWFPGDTWVPDRIRIGRYAPAPELPGEGELAEELMDILWEDGMSVHISWIEDGTSYHYSFKKEGSHVRLQSFTIHRLPHPFLPCCRGDVLRGSESGHGDEGVVAMAESDGGFVADTGRGGVFW